MPGCPCAIRPVPALQAPGLLCGRASLRAKPLGPHSMQGSCHSRDAGNKILAQAADLSVLYMQQACHSECSSRSYTDWCAHRCCLLILWCDKYIIPACDCMKAHNLLCSGNQVCTQQATAREGGRQTALACISTDEVQKSSMNQRNLDEYDSGLHPTVLPCRIAVWTPLSSRTSSLHHHQTMCYCSAGELCGV